MDVETPLTAEDFLALYGDQRCELVYGEVRDTRHRAGRAVT